MGACGQGTDARDRNGAESVRRRPVAELGVGVVAPAADGGVGEDGTRMVDAGGDRGGRREARDGDWGDTVRRRPVAELTEVVLAPAAGGGVGEEGARVEV